MLRRSRATRRLRRGHDRQTVGNPRETPISGEIRHKKCFGQIRGLGRPAHPGELSIPCCLNPLAIDSKPSGDKMSCQ
jgi:hypothetical protein